MLVGSRLVILDFGLARPIPTPEESGLTRSGILIGTLDWMAPEQLLGGYDERSDLYSAALILLQALKGKPSENESGGLAGALRRATGDTDFRKHLPADLPASWRYVLLRCLERDPSRRPASAKEAQELLTQRRSRFRSAAGNVIRSRWLKISVATAILVALVVLGFRYLRRPGLQPGSLIMVAATINSTGEPKFDGITYALRADLGQSSDFNIWDNQRLGEVSRSMRRDVTSPPQAKEWREIALREKAPLLVFSTLSRVGDGYSLAIHGEQIGRAPEPTQHWDQSFNATGPAGLFDAVHDAATWIRTTAGEKAADLSANNREPQEITTNNWEALQLYDQAQALSAAQRDTEAIPVLERAVQIDPQFAMGLMRLGDLLNAQYKSEEGFSYWRQAIALARAQHLSEHEKLAIESRYKLEIRDLGAAVPMLQDWVGKFPNDPLAPRLLAAALLGQRHYEEAIRVARQAQERFGPTVFGTSILIRALAARNQTADIEPQFQVLERLSAHSVALEFRGMVAAMRGEYDEAARLFRELASTAQGQAASRAAGLLAISEADRGRMDEARGILSAAIAKDREAGQDGLASQKTVALAFLEGQLGDASRARALAEQAVSIVGPSPQVILQSVTILARNGDVAAAAQLAKRFPGGEGPRFEAARLRMQGEIFAAKGEYAKAVVQLDRASNTDRPQDPKEYLARALELDGNRALARLTYQNMVNSPWLTWDLVEEEWPGTRYVAKQHLKELEGE
jgi:tetratricopeptide (TPR) repeat protein